MRSDIKRRQAAKAPKYEKILEALRAGHTFTMASKMAGISYELCKAWRRQDEAFAEACRDAFDQGTDVFIEELRRRAVEGVEKPVFYQGQVCGHITEYSDGLLLAELQKRDPAYRPWHGASPKDDGFDLSRLLRELDGEPSEAPAAPAPPANDRKRVN
jgi:hypothetical protein